MSPCLPTLSPSLRSIPEGQKPLSLQMPTVQDGVFYVNRKVPTRCGVRDQEMSGNASWEKRKLISVPDLEGWATESQGLKSRGIGKVWGKRNWQFIEEGVSDQSKLPRAQTMSRIMEEIVSSGIDYDGFTKIRHLDSILWGLGASLLKARRMLKL